MKRRFPLLAFAAFVFVAARVAPLAAHEVDDVHLPTVRPEPAPAGAVPPVGITGFEPESLATELAREARVAAIVKPDSLRRHLRILTEQPHVAGTPADRATAEYVLQRLRDYGWDAKIETFPVWINYPRKVRLELLEPVRETLAVRERGIAGDKDSHDAEVFDAFNGYSASGEVTAQVVYANYGDVDDFAKLAAMGIDLKGRIALVRYGRVFRGLKVRNAERAGLAGVIIYSDPEDDGFSQGEAYPLGPARPEDALQRGSVQFLSEGPGDPTTPGWPSTETGKRLPAAQAHGVPHIPSIPISYGEARKILAALEGPLPPHSWQGGLPLTYHVGPGGAKIHMNIQQDYAVRPIWNVVATMAGREHPEQQVVLGNHRDAWTYGGVDPNSGSIVMLELARALGTLAKGGWHPRRTITLCSWDGEEYGLLGSTEWAELHADELSAHAVAYLNVDAAVSGRDFSASGSHALRDLVAEAIRDVRDPGHNRPIWNDVVDRAWADGKGEFSARNRQRRWRGEAVRSFEWNLGALGSGSDYTAFVDHLGVPSLDFRYSGLHGTYHAMYDDFDYVDRVIDPGYAYHAAMTDLWGRIAMRLAEAKVLPLRYTNTATFAYDELNMLDDRADDACAGKPDSLRFNATLAGARQAAAKLRNTAFLLEQRADSALAGRGAWPAGGAEAINAALMRAERGLLGPGLPGREWFRHELYAPGLNTGYAAVPLPRLGQAVLDVNPRAWAQGVQPIIDALDRASAELAKVK